MADARELVRCTVDAGVCELVLDNPPVNVLSAALLDALLKRLDEVGRDPATRVVLLRGAAERAFAAGANIREMAPMGPEEARRHGQRGQSVTVAIERLAVPVVAAIHGACLGGGTEITLACDFVVASDDARFGQPEIDLGVMPGWGGTQRLPRRIGLTRAREWILTGRPVTAERAKELGLVLEVVPRARLAERSLELARELAGKSSTALAAAKVALRGAADRRLDAGLAEELELWAALFGTPDQRAGMAAFLEKRPWAPTARRPRAETP